MYYSDIVYITEYVWSRKEPSEWAELLTVISHLPSESNKETVKKAKLYSPCFKDTILINENHGIWC